MRKVGAGESSLLQIARVLSSHELFYFRESLLPRGPTLTTGWYVVPTYRPLYALRGINRANFYPKGFRRDEIGLESRSIVALTIRFPDKWLYLTTSFDCFNTSREEQIELPPDDLCNLISVFSKKLCLKCPCDPFCSRLLNTSPILVNFTFPFFVFWLLLLCTS